MVLVATWVKSSLTNTQTFLSLRMLSFPRGTMMLSLLLIIRKSFDAFDIRILSLSKIVDYADCVLPVENEALLSIYQRILAQCSSHRPGASTNTTIADNGDRVFTDKNAAQPKAFDTMVFTTQIKYIEQYSCQFTYEHDQLYEIRWINERGHQRYNDKFSPVPTVKVSY